MKDLVKQTERVQTIMQERDPVALKAAYRALFTSIVVSKMDEISMMRPDVLELLDCVFKIATGKRAPFGGKQIIFSGDFLQIPPVYRGYEKNVKTRWAFQSPIWQEANIFTQEFREIKRQEDREDEVVTANCVAWWTSWRPRGWSF